jgi:hypothetical protein
MLAQDAACMQNAAAAMAAAAKSNSSNSVQHRLGTTSGQHLLKQVLPTQLH